MNISDEQFSRLAGAINDPDIGGFSADPRRGGMPPRNKYMVGQRDVEEGIHALPSTGADIKAYADTNAVTLAQPDRHLGGWNAGEGYLDVPKGFPRTPEGESAARASTIENTQMAYGEMNSRGNYVGDKVSPFHPANFKDSDFSPIPTTETDQVEGWVGLPLHAAQFPKALKKDRRKPRPNQTASESFS